MSVPLRLLVVEDNVDDVELLVWELRSAGFDVLHERAEDERTMERALDDGTWDVVVSDWSMPRFSAPAAIRLLRRKGVAIPLFIVTGSTRDDLSAELGAAGFFEKGRLAGLPAAIHAAIGR